MPLAYSKSDAEAHCGGDDEALELFRDHVRGSVGPAAVHLHGPRRLDAILPKEPLATCVQTLSLSYCKIKTDDLATVVERLPSLTSLDLYNCDSLRGIDPLAGRPLRRLLVRSCDKIAADSISAVIPTLPALVKLDLSYCEGRVTDAAIAALPPTLTELCLDGCSAITDAGLAAALATAPGVTDLSLEHCDSLRDCSVALRPLRLVCLSLAENEELGDVSVAGLAASAATLTSIDLSSTAVTDAALAAHVAPCLGLKKLRLLCCAEITAAGYAALPALPALEELDVSGSAPVTDAVAGALPPRLRLLSMEWDELTDAGLVALCAACPALRDFDLTEASDQFSAAAIAEALGHLRAVENVDLSSTDATDAALAALVGSRTTLKKLVLQECAVSDAGLEALLRHGVPALEALMIEGCAEVTGAFICGLPFPSGVAGGVCSPLPSLAVLDLTRCCVEDDTVRAIVKATGHTLAKLYITEAIDLSDAALEAMTSAPQPDRTAPATSLAALRMLTINGCLDITRDGVLRLRALPLLDSLDLDGCGLPASLEQELGDRYSVSL